MIPSVNRILRRRSGVAKAERKAPSTQDLLGTAGGVAGLWRGDPHQYCGAGWWPALASLRAAARWQVVPGGNARTGPGSTRELLPTLTVKRCRGRGRYGPDDPATGTQSPRLQMTAAEPPAAAIFSFAVAEKACAVTASWMPPRSPLPRTLTSRFGRTAPATTNSSGPTVPPSGNNLARSSTLTTWYSTRKRFLKPLSLGSRMWIGICPPSNPAGTPLRALVPLVPRPAVLPLPPSPRPTLVLRVLDPGAGRRWWTLMVMTCRPPPPSPN